MKPFILSQDGATAPVILEETAVYGMEDMTDIFCGDIESVTLVRPEKKRHISREMTNAVVVATCGYSRILDQLEQAGDISLERVRGKREVYAIFLLYDTIAFPGKNLLLIAGSDKRGTIYGMFHISEKIGVSPWVYWADAVPKHKTEILFDSGIATISREPSVRYRGFFINDEQPCFGNWAKEKFGSNKPGPELYRHIFELLLRLKGNYIWPAMWRSDFTLDHIENAELAHRMGVIAGASHHEPCCRSGGEFQILRKENEKYGKEWSFLSNADGIREFWKDGLLRNREFESLITIGMRGEFDSYLMPNDATLEDNINVLKAAITEQKRLLKEYGNQDHPQLLAIYKEVEDYYQGDETTEGLKNWDLLRDDILMLCDDNFGHLRTLPGEEASRHPGGYGMYYHFDYYGGPVSYLWINSTPLTKIWEQMTMAYDFGVRDAWIVNVGDIKNQELPLSYFLDLAYDFESWGSTAINRTTEYTRNWLDCLGFTDPCFDGMEELLREYIKWNGCCRPEVLSSRTYHIAHFNEAGDMLDRVDTALEKTRTMREEMGEDHRLSDCFYELAYYPIAASANIIKMQIYAGLNQFYVAQRKKKGNLYAPLVEDCIRRDRELVREYHSLHGGKWNHMQSVYHIGYIDWNDEEWQYPDCHIFHPVCDPRLLVSVTGNIACTGGNPWRRKKQYIKLCDRTTSGFEVANSGEGTLHYRIQWDADWLEILAAPDSTSLTAPSPKKDGVPAMQTGIAEDGSRFILAHTEDCQNFLVRLKNSACNEASFQEPVLIQIYGENCEETAECSENGNSETRVDIEVQVEQFPTPTETADTGEAAPSEAVYAEFNGIVTVEAPHFSKNVATEKASWKVIKDFGKTMGGVKVFPTTSQFALDEDAPYIEYQIFVKEAGEYDLTLFTAPSNPVIYKGKMQVAVKTNAGEYHAVNTIPDEGYIPWLSSQWGRGVLEQIHRSTCPLSLQKGYNTLTFKAMDPAVVLEKLVITQKGRSCPDSYLGPKESFLL